jgi:hypothetical protein
VASWSPFRPSTWRTARKRGRGGCEKKM